MRVFMKENRWSYFSSSKYWVDFKVKEFVCFFWSRSNTSFFVYAFINFDSAIVPRTLLPPRWLWLPMLRRLCILFSSSSSVFGGIDMTLFLSIDDNRWDSIVSWRRGDLCRKGLADRRSRDVGVLYRFWLVGVPSRSRFREFERTLDTLPESERRS